MLYFNGNRKGGGGVPEDTATKAGVEALGEIAKNTTNDAVLLAIVVAIVLVVILVPLYMIYTKRDGERLTQYIQREGQILQVIKDNSEAYRQTSGVMTKLATLLENNDKHCDDCRSEQLARYDNILTRQEKMNNILTELNVKIEVGKG